MSNMDSADSWVQSDYRVPSTESFLRPSSIENVSVDAIPHSSGPEAPLIPPLCDSESELQAAGVQGGRIDAPAESDPTESEFSRLQSLCWELLRLAERLTDEGAPDRATQKEQLFLLREKFQTNFRSPENFRRSTPHTARLLRETELPSSSALLKFPIDKKFPDFDFPRIREFLAQHSTSRYTVALLRALVHHCTWKFIEISDRRAFLLALVAFDVLGGAPFVFARLAEHATTSETFAALVSVLACEWAGRAYLGKFPLLPLVQTLFRSPVDSPLSIQTLAAMQRLSFNSEVGNFFLECQVHEFLLTQVLVQVSMHSEFTAEFSLALISNLAELPDFAVSEGAMRVLRDLLRRSEVSVADIFRKILSAGTLKDLAFSVDVDAELERLVQESENPENFRSLLELLHAESRVSSAQKNVDSPNQCFLEDEELAQLAIGSSLAKETFVTKRFLGSKDEDRKFFADFLANLAGGRLGPDIPQTETKPALVERNKPKIWR